MEDNTGLKCILQDFFIYNFFQEIVGGNEARRKLVTDFVKVKPRQRVVEIGCGPAQLLRWLPAVEYIGFDTNKAYIDAAQKKYGRCGLFLVGDTKSLEDDERLLNADVVICSAILHHLDDGEAVHAMKFVYKILKRGGRLICGEPCRVPHQGIISRWIMSNDRGKNIRTEHGYQKLVKQVFSNVRMTLDPRPLRIPSASVYMECIK